MSRYVLLYQGITDPSSQEESTLVASLKNAKIIDRMPGSLLVDAAESELTALMQKFKKWSFTPDVGVVVKPPRKRIANPF